MEKNQYINKWEYNILLSLIVILTVATIVDLEIKFSQIINIIIH